MVAPMVLCRKRKRCNNFGEILQYLLLITVDVLDVLIQQLSVSNVSSAYPFLEKKKCIKMSVKF